MIEPEHVEPAETGPRDQSPESPPQPQPDAIDKLLKLVRSVFVLNGMYLVAVYGFLAAGADPAVYKGLQRELAAQGKGPVAESRLRADPRTSNAMAELVLQIRLVAAGFIAAGIAFIIVAVVMNWHPLAGVALGIPLEIGEFVAHAIAYPSKTGAIAVVGQSIAMIVLAGLLVALIRRQQRSL